MNVQSITNRATATGSFGATLVTSNPAQAQFVVGLVTSVQHLVNLSSLFLTTKTQRHQLVQAGPIDHPVCSL